MTGLAPAREVLAVVLDEVVVAAREQLLRPCEHRGHRIALAVLHDLHGADALLAREALDAAPPDGGGALALG